MTDFLLEEIESSGVYKVLEHRRRNASGLNKVRKYREAFMTSPRTGSTYFFDQDYLQELAQITPDDTVLFFGVENLKDLMILQKFINTSRLFLWIWNPIANINKTIVSKQAYPWHLKKAGYDVYTFDASDAMRYGFRLTDQVYRDVSVYISPDTNIEADLFFVGQDKGRLPQILRLKQLADREEINYDFHIVTGKHTKPCSSLSSYMTHEIMPYKETLSRINRSCCLVEIRQPRQQGSSLRPLEALFLKKKLVSDNPDLRKASYYHPDNIYILGDESRHLRDFLNLPFQEIDPGIRNQYDIRHWLRQFDV